MQRLPLRRYRQTWTASPQSISAHRNGKYSESACGSVPHPAQYRTASSPGIPDDHPPYYKTSFRSTHRQAIPQKYELPALESGKKWPSLRRLTDVYDTPKE